MRRWVGGLTVMSILLTGFCWTMGVQADDSTLTIKEIMGKLHKPPDALRTALQKALKNSNPDWDKIQKDTQKFLELAEAMQMLEPPRGTKKSWEKQSKIFAETAKAMNDAAEKKDKKGVLSAHQKLGNCTSCHKEHKPKT